MIGKTISHYRILEKLGEGGMGIVYKAEDFKLGRHVVLKFLAPVLTRDPQAIERFINEAKTASALDHPNICTIYEIDETDDGQLFIAMAYYEGETLREKVDSGQLAVAEAVEVATQVAQGLARAHEAGIIHRDIKPANIIITKRGEVKIVDFGLAKLAGTQHLTKTGGTVGTVAYMSPEQTRGAKVDHRADIWALGAVLYEMITGQLPFKGDCEAAVLYAIVNEEPDFSNIPGEAGRVVQKALAKHVEDRYDNVQDLLADLKTLKVPHLVGRPGSKTRRAATKKWPLLIGALAVLALLAMVAIFLFRGFTPHAIDRKSIAVLPFENMSGDPEQEYFCDGMAEELINALSQVRGLHVVARTSAFSFKRQNTDIHTIGEKLNVETILEGSVRKAGDRFRITTQLISVADGYQLWSQRYDRQLEDVFAIQDEISTSIVGKLKVELLGEQPPVLVQRATDNMEAYTLYLKGLHYRRKWSPEAMPQAVACFKKAIELDPEFAKPHAALAECYFEMSDVGGLSLLSREEAYPLIKNAVEKALALDNTAGEAYIVLGQLKCVFEWDWAGGEQAYKRALELSPNDASMLTLSAYFYFITGRYDEAIAIAHRAEALDPLSLVTQHNIAASYFFARRFDDAIKRCQHIIDMDDHYFLAYLFLSPSFACKNEFEQALATCQKAISIFGRHPLLLNEMARVYGRWGKRAEALQLIAEIEKLSEKRRVSQVLFAWSAIALGEQEKAIMHIEKAFAERDLGIPFFLNWPWPEMETLRSHPRIQAVMQKMGLKL